MNQDKHNSVCRQVSYGRLMLQSLPEILCFQLLSEIPMVVLTWSLNRLIKAVAESGGSAVTTANLKDMLFSWRGPVILLLGALLVAVFAAFEIFAQIHLYDDIVNGRKLSLRGEIVKGFRSLRLFLCPSGLLVLLYIFIAVPLLGVGFSISLTENFYIPNFIMEVVRAKPLYNAAYWVLITALGVVGLCGIFTLHGVTIDRMKPSAAFKASFRVLKNNWKKLLMFMLVAALVMTLVIGGVMMLLDYAGDLLNEAGNRFPRGHFVDIKSVLGGVAIDTDMEVVGYRVASALLVIGGGLLFVLISLIAGSYFLMRLT